MFRTIRNLKLYLLTGALDWNDDRHARCAFGALNYCKVPITSNNYVYLCSENIASVFDVVHVREEPGHRRLAIRTQANGYQ